MSQIFSITLTTDELLYVLVLSGVEDEEKYEDYDLNIEDISRERLESGRKSLQDRGLLYGDGPLPQLDNTLTALVSATIIGEKVGVEYTEQSTGLHVQFLKEEGMYVFRGKIDES